MEKIIKKINQFCDEFELPDVDISTPEKLQEYIKFRLGDKMLSEEVRELEKGVKDGDIHEILDGAGDTIFIAVNTYYVLSKKNILINEEAHRLEPICSSLNFVKRINASISYHNRYTESYISDEGLTNFFLTDLQRIVQTAFTLLIKHLSELNYNTENAINHAWSILERIADANLAKKHDGKVVKKDGKIIKPEGWKEPRFDDIISGV